MRRRTVTLLTVLLVAACTDGGPDSGPGSITVTLDSPHGAEGAAALTLVGGGIGEVTGVGSTEVHTFADQYGTRIVLIDQAGGTLAFRVALADTTALPVFALEEVAGPDDVLRGSLAQYAWRFER